MFISKEKIETFQNNIIYWFQNNKRNFPWRENPVTPWNALVSEMLLQKTNADKVVSVYSEIINLYTSPIDLSNAGNELENIISTLGIITRADVMRRISKTLVDNYNGEIPGNYDQLINLPGVGRYIASAILCFSFNKAIPIVDTNVIRIFNRVFSVKSSKKNNPERDKNIWSFAANILPEHSAQEYNLALIDFGALVCKHRRQECLSCPINCICNNYATNNQ